MSRTYFTDSVSDLCQGIIDKADTYEKRIKYLEEENKKLKDEHYKDSEMQRMKTELKKAKDDLYRGFPISKEEEEKIKEWQLKHDAEKHGLKTMEQRLRAGGCSGGKIYISICSHRYWNCWRGDLLMWREIYIPGFFIGEIK